MKKGTGKFATTSGGLRRKVVYLPPETETALRDLAHEARISESEIVRQALQEYLLDRQRKGKR